MDKLVDLGMTKLFTLAEYVCGKIGVVQPETPPIPQPNLDTKPTIHFSKADRLVEGELFK